MRWIGRTSLVAAEYWLSRKILFSGVARRRSAPVSIDDGRGKFFTNGFHKWEWWWYSMNGKPRAERPKVNSPSLTSRADESPFDGFPGLTSEVSPVPHLDLGWRQVAQELRQQRAEERAQWGEWNDLLYARYLAGATSPLESTAVEKASLQYPRVRECLALVREILGEPGAGDIPEECLELGANACENAVNPQVIADATMSVEDQWATLASELHAQRLAQHAVWGELDELLLARYLAGECTAEEIAQVEQSRAGYPRLADCLTMVRDLLNDANKSAPNPRSPWAGLTPSPMVWAIAADSSSAPVEDEKGLAEKVQGKIVGVKNGDVRKVGERLSNWQRQFAHFGQGLGAIGIGMALGLIVVLMSIPTRPSRETAANTSSALPSTVGYSTPNSDSPRNPVALVTDSPAPMLSLSARVPTSLPTRTMDTRRVDGLAPGPRLAPATTLHLFSEAELRLPNEDVTRNARVAAQTFPRLVREPIETACYCLTCKDHPGAQTALKHAEKAAANDPQAMRIIRQLQATLSTEKQITK